MLSFWAALEQPVDFIIAEGVVTNPFTVTQRIMELKQRKLLLPETLPVLRDVLQNLSIPMLFFSGTEDVITTISDVHQALRQHPERQVIAYAGGHDAGLPVMQQTYFRYIDSFLKGLKK